MQSLHIVFITISGSLFITGFLIYKKGNKSLNKANHSTTITGKAINSNRGAIIISDSFEIFFIKGLSRWEKGWENKKVKIIGDLEFTAGQNPCLVNAIVQMLEITN